MKFNLMGEDFNYIEVFNSLDYEVFKKDIEVVLIDFKDWWLVDFGNYGLFFICMVWYSVGIYWFGDGWGGFCVGQQWFVFFNSWFDNVNLDKVWCFFWLVKQKYGSKILWVDFMILIGNVVLEFMGFEIIGFFGGCEDVWEFESDVYWGVEMEWLDDVCYQNGELENLLVVMQMGFIYVNLEGLGGNFDFLEVVKVIWEIFVRMGMNDEEIIVLNVGGYMFGKIYGRGLVFYVGVDFEVVGIEE